MALSAFLFFCGIAVSSGFVVTTEFKLSSAKASIQQHKICRTLFQSPTLTTTLPSPPSADQPIPNTNRPIIKYKIIEVETVNGLKHEPDFHLQNVCDEAFLCRDFNLGLD